MKNVWRIFGSINLAIVLIILITLACVLGTLIPQHRPAAEYAARYGGPARLIAPLALDRLYQSPGFIGLLLLFAANLSVCTLARVPSKVRKAFGNGWTSDSGDFGAWKTKEFFLLRGAPAETVTTVSARLRRARYRVRKTTDGSRVLIRGMKNRLGGFGADFVHLGLLIVLVGGIVSGLGGFKTDIALTRGATAPVRTGGLELRLDAFRTEYYPGGSVRDWKSEIAVIREGRVRATGTIEVNRPLRCEDVLFYQSGYGRDWENPILELWVRRKGDPAVLKKISFKPGETTQFGEGTTIAAVRFVPDFVLAEGNEVSSRSNEPNNPAVLIEVRKEGEPAASAWVFAKYPEFSHFPDSNRVDLTFELKDAAAPEFSVIQAVRDPGALLIWIGCAILMAGLFFAFYLPPREVRVALRAGREHSTSVAAGGLATKAREAFEIEFAGLMTDLRRQR
jgi:cytochrome c biogenesis protein